MTTPHPLNQAVVTEALHLLRSGQFRGCLAMGISQRVVEALMQPALVSALVNAKVPWCRVSVNEDVIDRVLARASDYDKEYEATARMLRLGASTEMVSEFYGLSHQEVAFRRQLLSLPNRRGRWPVLSEEQDTALWHRWSSRLKAEGIALDDDEAMLALGMDLAEEMSLPLSVVWSAISNWIQTGRR